MLRLCANICVGELIHHIWACTSMQAHACMVSDTPILNLLFVHMYDHLYIQEHMESQVHIQTHRCTHGSQVHRWTRAQTDTDSCTQPCTHSHKSAHLCSCVHTHTHTHTLRHSLSLTHSLTPVLPLGEHCWQFWHLKLQASCSGGAETGHAGESRLKQGLL